jgi:hypothetical protein
MISYINSNLSKVGCTADGDFLPLYVVYKANNLQTNWMNDGPKDCRFNCSENGWMTGPVFLDYFKSVLIEYCKTIEPGKDYFNLTS